MKNVIIAVVTAFGCMAIVMYLFKSEDYEKYDVAIKYIITDVDFIQMLKDFNRYDESILFKDDELIYKVYPDILNEFYLSFAMDIEELVKEGKVAEVNFESINENSLVDSSLVKYSKSDTANVQIFFSQVKGNLLSAEAFSNISDVPAQYDGYRAIAMSNIGMQYLFVFKKKKLIEVRKEVVQYN
jgi:hypothetical protein